MWGGVIWCHLCVLESGTCFLPCLWWLSGIDSLYIASMDKILSQHENVRTTCLQAITILRRHATNNAYQRIIGLLSSDLVKHTTCQPQKSTCATVLSPFSMGSLASVYAVFVVLIWYDPVARIPFCRSFTVLFWETLKRKGFNLDQVGMVGYIRLDW